MARSQLLQRPSRRGDPPARAPTAGSRGSATLGRLTTPAVSRRPPWPGWRAPPSKTLRPRGASSSSRTQPGGGARKIRSSGSGEGKKAQESPSGAALHAEVSRLNRLEL